MTDTRTWNVVGIHGQPPPNTLIDVAPVGLTVSVMQTAAVPDLRPATKWRLSDLPPLDAVQPAPAPGRPEPKFKIGDRVQWYPPSANGKPASEPLDVVKIYDDGTSTWVCRLSNGWNRGEGVLRPAPEPSIPIGGWFDPGDGRTLQRVTCPTERIPDCALIHYENNGVHPGLVGTTCSPLTEREAMERLYPVGTWLRSAIGSNVIVAAHNDTDRPVKVLFNGDPEAHDTVRCAWLKRCTVLPGPPLPAWAKPIDELPDDMPGDTILLLLYMEGKRRTDTAANAFRLRHLLRAWADLDDVAPIPAHLRSTP